MMSFAADGTEGAEKFKSIGTKQVSRKKAYIPRKVFLFRVLFFEPAVYGLYVPSLRIHQEGIFRIPSVGYEDLSALNLQSPFSKKLDRA